MEIKKEFLESSDLKIWEIYWFDRTWLSEKASKNKGDYRPCVVIWKTKRQLAVVPMSSTPTSSEWNIEYKSATRKEISNLHIDNLRILDPRALKNSKRCKPHINVTNKKLNARVTSEKIKKEMLIKIRKLLSKI